MKSLFVLCLFLCHGVYAQQSTIKQLNEKLGKGINMGNMFEGPEEGEWGNPFRADYFAKIAALGFDHVRIPVRWDTPSRTLQEPPYTIARNFLQRIQEVVDLASKEGLMVIINMHHHDALFESPLQEREKFLAQWSQIATYFKDYPETLLFEVLNEPHAALTPPLWNTYFAEALSHIRQTNPTRAVLMGTAEFGGVSGINSLILPDDPNIIVSVHFYSPFSFTHQGAEWVGEHADAWLGTSWYDLEYERESLRQELKAIVDFSQQKNIPIHMGEFGSYGKADMVSRLKWTNFLARYFESLGFSWAYWEWSAGFGIYDPVRNTYREDLANALLNDPLDEPQNAHPVAVYESDFTSSNQGWTLINQQGASGSLAREENKLHIQLDKTGTENWHSQLSRTGFELRQGVLYRVSFLANAQIPTSITHYMGESSSPYQSYSGYMSFQLDENEQGYAYVFQVMAPDDDNARMVIDLGQRETSFSFRSFKLEELNFLVSSIPSKSFEKIQVFPNPVDRELKIDRIEVGTTGRLFSPTGQLLREIHFYTGSATVKMENYPAGLYFLHLNTARSYQVLRVIKE